MAIIYSYPQVKPKTTDLLIGTVTYDAAGTYPVDGNPTRTFSVQDIANLAASYTLTTQQNGTSSTLTLKSDAGSLSVVNLFRGSGISLNSNGSNTITIGNLGVLSANASNTNFINMTPSAASTGNVTFSASLSASGSAGSSTYLRGDNTWATPVTTVSAASTTFIDLTPLSALNGDVQISAALSATGIPTSQNFLRGDNQWAVPAGGGTVTSVNSGTGISVDNTDPDNPIVNNTGVLSNIAGTGISISGATGNSTITNTAPDQTVVITGSGDTTVTGTYPNFNVSSDSGVKSIVAGSNVTISPASGLGDVTINAVAGGGIMAGWNLELTAPNQFPVYSTITNNEYLKLSTSSEEIVMTMLVNDPAYNGTWASWDLDLSRTGASLGVQSASDFIMFTRPELSGQPDLIAGQYKVLPSNISLSVFGTPISDLNIGTNKLTNVVNPTAAQDAATKNYVDNAVVGGLIYQGGYDAATNTPVLDSRGTQIAVTQGWTYTVTVDGTFYGETVKVGDVLIAETNLAAGTGALTDWTTVQSNIDLATAGTTGTAVRGLAGFDSNDFTVTGGFVEIIDKGYVPYTGATQNVNLGTRTLTSGDLTVNHASGSGTAVTINKGGNGAGLLINKTSGSGDALSVTGSANISSSITASSFVKSGGTSVQFLKADGSVDSNTYLTNAVTSITAGTGLDGGTITTTGTIDLADTAVTPGAYTNANITVDQQGRITLASNGDPGGVTSFTASNGTFITLTPNTSQTGAATLTADLSASGTADATTFLRGDNQWVTVAGTTYDYSSAQSGADVNLNLIPSTGTTDTVKLVAGSGVTLTDDGSNNITINAVAPTNTLVQDDYTGDGTDTTFQLSVTPLNELFTTVYLAGVYQEKDTYSLSGDVVTFSTAPPDGVSIEVMTIANVSVSGTVTSVNGRTGAVTIIASDIPDDSISYDKVGTEFTTVQAATSETFDFESAQVFTRTLSGTPTLVFSNAKTGMVKDLILDGDVTIAWPAGTKFANGTYSGTVTNFIQVVVIADGNYWVTISQEQA